MDSPCFVEDIYPPHTLYGFTLRSPVARGRLKSIEYPKFPTSYTLITAADIPGKNRLLDSEIPILASDLLSYIGEPVALLLGPERNMLEQYARQCKVIAEEEVPDFSGNTVNDETILARRELRVGDPEAAFTNAKTIIRGDYSTGIQEHWYAEPTGAVVWFEQQGPQAGEGDNEDNGKKKGKHPGKTLVARTATQWPYHVKRSIVQALKLTPDLVRVEPTIIGLHLDGKLWYPSLVACHAALGALVTKKPVRLVLTREEDFRFSPKRFGTGISIASALDEKGEITGVEIDISINLGAYQVNGDEMLDETCLGSLGIYHFDNMKLTGKAVRTNIPPQGPFSGFGLAQGFFALECHASHTADALRQNPVERRKNQFTRNSVLGMVSREPAPGAQLLDTAAAMSRYYRKWASYELLRQSRRNFHGGDENSEYNRSEKGERLRGIGAALGCQGNGFLYPGSDKGNYTLELTLGKDGSLEIKTSIVSSDEHYGGIWAAKAAEILSIAPDTVHILNNTNYPDSGPSCVSRSIAVLTRLVEQACLAIQKQRFRNPLPITVRKTVRPQKNAWWEERFPPPDGKSLDASGFARPGWASAVVEVEIDPIEYIPAIRGVWMSVAGGKILSEERARRTLKTAAVEALGWAYREQISYCEGRLSQAEFADYNIPSPIEIPPVHIDFIWNDTAEPKGIGDLPFACIPAAYIQAVSQAMDYHFQSIPLCREAIWEAAKLKKTESRVP